MLSLLSPTALWTLTACALPLAIHLWRKPPRIVRLGSLRFLETTARRPWQNLRWRELLLLSLRLALLVALTLLLARPRWITPPSVGPRRWALLDPTANLTGDSLARWQKLKDTGYELHRLTPGFPATGADAAMDNAPAPDLWSLLREVDAELPAGSTLAVFTPGRLAALRGTRPTLGHCSVEWVRTADAGGNEPFTWIASLTASGHDSPPDVIAGRSDSQSTQMWAGKLAGPLVFPGRGDERWRTEFMQPANSDAASARILGRANHPADDPGPWIARMPAPAATSVLILHDAEHANDARYVEAAVRAAADSAGRPIHLQNREITPDVDNAAVTDWTFWLSIRRLPEGLAARATRLVQYAGGEPVISDDRIVAPPGDATDGVRVWKRTTASQTQGRVAWWFDGQGNPLLTYSYPANGERWELCTRFDPTWCDLPRTSALPAWLRTLLFTEAAAAGPVHDRRLADPLQGQPSEGSTSVTIPTLISADQPTRDLTWPLWIIAATLFAAERLLSLSRRSAAQCSISPISTPPTAVVAR